MWTNKPSFSDGKIVGVTPKVELVSIINDLKTVPKHRFDLVPELATVEQFHRVASRKIENTVPRFSTISTAILSQSGRLVQMTL